MKLVIEKKKGGFPPPFLSPLTEGIVALVNDVVPRPIIKGEEKGFRFINASEGVNGLVGVGDFIEKESYLINGIDFLIGHHDFGFCEIVVGEFHF